MIRQRDFPKSFNIGDDVWQIRFCRKIPEHGPNILGLCDPSTFTVWVLQGQTPEERFKTIVHEILHCAEFSLNFEMPHKSIYDLEEAVSRLWTDNIG